MLRYLRENTGNWIIKIFLGIIVIVFVFLGVGSMNANKRNEVAKVNDQPITFNEFQDAYKNLIQQMRQRFGNALNDDLVKALNIKQQAVNSLIDQKLMDMEADKLKIMVSDQELEEALLSIKAFQKDGAFNMEMYTRVLSQNSLTPETFEALQRRAIKNAKLREMVLSGITVSDTEARTWYTFKNTQMAIDYIKVDPGSFTDIVPTDAQVKAQYKENLNLYQFRPKRKAVYLVFSPDDHLGSAAGIGDEQVKEYYEQNLARFTTPEQVEASHILIKVDQDASEEDVAAARKLADDAYEKASKGGDFAELAKAVSQGPSASDGGYLGRFDKKSMVKPFGDAAFAMEKGQISKPVRTQFGFHIIKVTDKTPVLVEPFDTAKNTIFKELAAQELQNLAYYKAGEAFDAVVDGDDFEQVALVAKKKVIETQAFTDDGQGLAMENASEFAKTAFALTTDDISEVKQMGDKYYLIKIVEKIDPKQLPLEEVDAQILESLTAIQQKEAAAELAQTLLEKVESGASFAKIVQENKLDLKTSPLFTRDQYIQGIPGSQEMVAAAFTLDKQGAVYSKVVKAGPDFYIIGFNDKQVPDEAAAMENEDKVRQEMAYMKQQKYYTAWVQSLKANANIEINTEIIN
ncbi:MAG: SurA N-terminal domain-containing protein [Desulfobacter sp.]|nr:SurA N-terminal domain-containing protein [Desulfobacter sp.]